MNRENFNKYCNGRYYMYEYGKKCDVSRYKKARIQVLKSIKSVVTLCKCSIKLQRCLFSERITEDIHY